MENSNFYLFLAAALVLVFASAFLFGDLLMNITGIVAAGGSIEEAIGNTMASWSSPNVDIYTFRNTGITPNSQAEGNNACSTNWPGTHWCTKEELDNVKIVDKGHIGFAKGSRQFIFTSGTDGCFGGIVCSVNGVRQGAAQVCENTANNNRFCFGEALICCENRGDRVCKDGTRYGDCSLDKPRLCNNGILAENYCFGPDKIAGTRDDCGCPTGQECMKDGSCKVKDDFLTKPVVFYQHVDPTDFELLKWFRNIGMDGMISLWADWYEDKGDFANKIKTWGAYVKKGKEIGMEYFYVHVQLTRKNTRKKELGEFIPNWFDDEKWQTVYNNFKDIGAYSKEIGANGVQFDPEVYYVNRCPGGDMGCHIWDKYYFMYTKELNVKGISSKGKEYLITLKTVPEDVKNKKVFISYDSEEENFRWEAIANSNGEIVISNSNVLRSYISKDKWPDVSWYSKIYDIANFQVKSKTREEKEVLDKIEERSAKITSSILSRNPSAEINVLWADYLLYIEPAVAGAYLKGILKTAPGKVTILSESLYASKMGRNTWSDACEYMSKDLEKRMEGIGIPRENYKISFGSWPLQETKTNLLPDDFKEQMKAFEKCSDAPYVWIFLMGEAWYPQEFRARTAYIDSSEYINVLTQKNNFVEIDYFTYRSVGFTPKTKLQGNSVCSSNWPGTHWCTKSEFDAAFKVGQDEETCRRYNANKPSWNPYYCHKGESALGTRVLFYDETSSCRGIQGICSTNRIGQGKTCENRYCTGEALVCCINK